LKITFYGGAEEVGRSCILVHSGDTKILLDAGVKLGAVVEHPQVPKHLLKEIDAVVISHSHLDHVGWLPHLFSAGYKGKVYATKPTIELTNVLISDYMRISEQKDVTDEALATMQKSYHILEFREAKKIKDITVSMIPAGHIVGSAMITVSSRGESLLYTGDVNLTKTKLLEGADTRNLSATTLITESTYSSKVDIFQPESAVAKKAAESMKETLQNGGKVLIPSFAVGRAQEILLILDDFMNSGTLPKVPIYIDGMIKKALRIYRHNVIYCRKEIQRRILMSDYDPFRSDNFVPIERKGMRNKIIAEPQSSIIVTTGGMLTGGPVLSYIPRLASNPLNKMILVGYQGQGTAGRALQDGSKTMKIDGRDVAIKMAVETYHLSAHADRKQLDMLISRVKGLKNIFIMHGEINKLNEFKSDLSRKYNAVIPKMGTEYTV